MALGTVKWFNDSKGLGLACLATMWTHPSVPPEAEPNAGDLGYVNSPILALDEQPNLDQVGAKSIHPEV